jgi:hypothetical protein
MFALLSDPEGRRTWAVDGTYHHHRVGLKGFEQVAVSRTLEDLAEAIDSGGRIACSGLWGQFRKYLIVLVDALLVNVAVQH